MDEMEWLIAEAKKNQHESKSYEDRAFYGQLVVAIQELSIRLEQKQSELDGRIWNHKGW